MLMTSNPSVVSPFQKLKSTVSEIPLWMKISGVILAALVIWFIYAQLQPASTATTTYQTTKVEKGQLVVSLSSSGTVSSANSGSATTTATGVVKKIYAKNGEVVKPGATLLELELDQASQQKYSAASASYQSAKNALNSAKTTQLSLQAEMFGKWDTYRQLAESATYQDTGSTNRALPEFHISQNEWLVTEQKYTQQQAVIAQAQTSLNSAWLSLQQASPKVTAPIGGTVSGMSSQVGSVIGSGTTSSTTTTSSQKIANITTEASPTVTVNLTEIDVPKVKTDNKVTLTIDALPGKTFTGKVISIDMVGSVSSGVTTYPAVIALDTAAQDIFSNMTAQASIITQVKDSVLLVPTSAVKTANGQSTVQRMKDGKPETVTVELGTASTTQVEISSGIAEGDEVVTSSVTPTSAAASTTSTTSVFSSLGGRGFGGTSGAGNAVIRTR